MPKISFKALAMPDSPIRRLSPLASAAKQRGIHVHHLNIGQPDLLSPEPSQQSLQKTNGDIWQYGPSEGLNTYKESLINYYAQKGIDLEAEHILPTNGASEAITMALAVIANPGDEIVIPEPFYANYTAFLVQTGLKTVPIECTAQQNYALPSIEDFKKAITEKTRAIFICNPCNPTGAVYSKEQLQDLAQLIHEKDIFLISDEVYSEFIYDGEFFSILQFPEIAEHSILIDSESKRFSLCGARIGALISKNEEFMQQVLKFARARLCAVTSSQLVAAAAHNQAKEYLTKTKAEFRSRIAYSINRLNQIEGVKAYQPQGAFYAFIELPVDNSDHFCAWLLTDFNHEGETLMLAPGSGFYSNPEKGRNKVRLAFVLNQKKLTRCFDLLEIALNQYHLPKTNTNKQLHVSG